MENSIRNFIDQQLELGAMAVHSELAVVPLLCRQPGGPDYITLKEAFASGGFAVTEISESGSVPNLKVVNSTGRNVLLLDGEELAGAKQNRVTSTPLRFLFESTGQIIHFTNGVGPTARARVIFCFFKPEQLAELLHRVHFIEKWGRGIKMILEREPETEFEELGTILLLLLNGTVTSLQSRTVQVKQTGKRRT